MTDGKLILPDGKTIERTVNHEREWIAGFMTPNIWDDECLITGTASGKNLEGIAYTRTILDALHWKRVCQFIVSGVVEIDREMQNLLTLITVRVNVTIKRLSPGAVNQKRFS